jgi:hypothetical protein
MAEFNLEEQDPEEDIMAPVYKKAALSKALRGGTRSLHFRVNYNEVLAICGRVNIDAVRSL